MQLKIAVIIPIVMTLLTIGSPKAEAVESPLQNIKNFIKTNKTIIYNQINENSTSLDSKRQAEDISASKEKKDDRRVPKEISDPREIEDAAEFASQATGVRKDFLMGMLAVESDLGRKTGECTYGEVTDGAEKSYANGRLGQRAWNTFQERQKIIKSLAKELGYDAEKLKVSCNPSGYAGTGGALGVPQFMPDMWMIYKDRISAIVGNENPDPWNARDGVVAMALLLSDTPGVTAHNYYAERNSAKMYLSGTTSSAYDWYANQALYWSKNYKSLLT